MSGLGRYIDMEIFLEAIVDRLREMFRENPKLKSSEVMECIDDMCNHFGLELSPENIEIVLVQFGFELYGFSQTA